MSRKTGFSISKQLFKAGVKWPHESVWVKIPRTQVKNFIAEGDTRIVPANAELWSNLAERYPAYEATELLDAMPHHLFIDGKWFDLRLTKSFQGKDSAYDNAEIGPIYKAGYYTTDPGRGHIWSIVQEQRGNSLEIPLAFVVMELLEKQYATLDTLTEQIAYLQWQNFGEPNQFLFDD